MSTMFELRRTELADQISSLLSSLHMSTHLSDLNLVCKGGQRVPTHKFLLAACSPTLNTFFKNKPTDKELYVTSFSSQAATLVLEVLYKGVSQVGTDDLQECKGLGKQLGIFPLLVKKVPEKEANTEIPPLEPPPLPAFLTGEGSSQSMFTDLLPPTPQIQQNKRSYPSDSSTEICVPPKKPADEDFNGKCMKCPKTFQVNYLCYAHEMLAHGISYPICAFCCKPYLCQEDVDKHVQAEHADHYLIATNQKEGNYQCGISQLHQCFKCERYFTQKMIDAHKFVMHDIPFIGCPICAKKFPTQQKMYYHAKNLHVRKLML